MRWGGAAGLIVLWALSVPWARASQDEIDPLQQEQLRFERITSSFVESALSLRAHRASMLKAVHEADNYAGLEKHTPDSRSGLRVNLRWAGPDSFQLRNLSVGLRDGDRMASSVDLNLAQDPAWGLKWYGVFLPRTPALSSVLEVEAEYLESRSLTPFSKKNQIHRAKGTLALLHASQKPVLLRVELLAPELLKLSVINSEEAP